MCKTQRRNDAHFGTDIAGTDSAAADGSRDPMAPRRRPGHSLAGVARFGRGGGAHRRARAAKGGARRMGGASARQAGPGGDVGGRAVVGWRALLAKMDLHYLHDAAAPRLRPASRQPAGATGLHGPSRPRAPAGRRHQLRHLGSELGSERDVHHGDGAFYHTIADHLLDQQMPDGGWNCRRPAGATHSSVNTTISVLEGLRLYEMHRGRNAPEVRAAQRRGREFLLVHRLFRSDRTGEVIKPAFIRLAFPPRWHYDILRALDYFQAVDAPRDPRLAEAIDIIRGSRREDGRWPLDPAGPALVGPGGRHTITVMPGSNCVGAPKTGGWATHFRRSAAEWGASGQGLGGQTQGEGITCVLPPR